MMPFANTIYTTNMNPQQRAWFYAEYEHARKDEVVGVLFALFLGCFGIHHFYLRRNGLGVFYILISWTGISTILGFIECFLMPGRVRDYNAAQAAYIAGYILCAPVSQPPLVAPPAELHWSRMQSFVRTVGLPLQSANRSSPSRRPKDALNKYLF